jgi:hypothetical protein
VDDPGTVRPVCKGGLGSLSGRDPRTPQAGSACSAPRGPDPDGAPPALFLTARAARGGHSRATGPRALRTPALMPANRVCAPYFRARAACPDGSGKERSGQIRTDRRGPRRTVASLPPQPGQRPDQNGIAPDHARSAIGRIFRAAASHKFGRSVKRGMAREPHSAAASLATGELRAFCAAPGVAKQRAATPAEHAA